MKNNYTYPGQTKSRKVIIIVSLVIILLLGLFCGSIWLYEKKVEDLNGQYQTKIDNQEKFKNELLEKLHQNKKTGKNISYEEQLFKAIQSLQPRIDPSIGKSIISSVLEESTLRDLDPELILALIFVESGFNHLAESEMGAVGLMQVRYETWKETPQLKDNGVEAKYHLFWISENVQCGTTIFKKYLDREKGNLGKALRRYNSGRELTTLPYHNEYVNKVTYTLLLIRQNLRNQKVENDKTNIGTTDSIG